MEIDSTSDIINLLTTFLSLFFALFLLTLRSGNVLSNRLIAAYLIIYALDSGTFISSQLIAVRYPGWGLFLNSFLFFGPPLLYLYVCSVCYEDMRIRRKDIIHAIPFVLAFVLLIPRFYMQSHEGKIAVLSGEDEILPEMILVYLLLHLQIVGYLIASFRVVFRSKRVLLENYASGSINHFNWLLSLLTIMSMEVVVSSFKNLFLLNGLDREYDLTLTMTGSVALVFICWLVLQALRSPEIYGKVYSQETPVRNFLHANPKAESKKGGGEIQMSPEDERRIAALMRHMETQEPFLNASLSIYDLAKDLNVPVKELSVLINHHLKKHFFDFVNGYRIEKAKEMLKDPKKVDMTVLEILYDVGFNSKSSFNTAFKKETQMTPTQFRNLVTAET